MFIEILVFALVLSVPAPVGYALGRWRPQGKNLRHAFIAALPACLPFFGFALWITLTQDMSVAEDAQIENLAPVWAIALYVLGVVTFVTGFGLGLLGDTYARNQAKKGVE